MSKSMRTDKVFRDYVNSLNENKTEIRKLKDAINKINDRSTSLVATGSFGEEPSNSHSALEGIQGNGPLHLSDDEVNHLDFFNGTFGESITAAITEAAGVVTLTIGQSGGGNLTGRFVSGYGFLPDNSTIALTVGASDAAPQVNYIYVLQSDPTALVKSTSDWPWTVDHIKITKIVCPTAAFVSANGVYSFHLWNDEDDNTIFQGHMAHMTDRERAFGARWDTGVTGNGTSGYLTPTANNVELIANVGTVYQMHRHDIPVFDTRPSGSGGQDSVVLVKNWNGDAYHDITNLYDIVADSLGNAIGATKWFKITIWGVANLGSSDFHPMIINLPSGSENTQARAELDANGYGDTVIPDEFRGTGYLIASIVIQRAATWVIGSTKDLRGQTAATIGGGGSRYTDAEVEAYVSSVANAGIATGDSLVFTDVGSSGVLKQDLVSDLFALIALANLSDVSLTGAQLEEMLAFTDGNPIQIPCLFVGNNQDGQAGYVMGAGIVTGKASVANPTYEYHIVYPTVLGTLSLTLIDLEISLFDADGSDFITRTRIFGTKQSTQTNKFDDLTNFATAGIINTGDELAALTNFDASGFSTIAIFIEAIQATDGQLDIGGVNLTGYYS